MISVIRFSNKLKLQIVSHVILFLAYYSTGYSQSNVLILHVNNGGNPNNFQCIQQVAGSTAIFTSCPFSWVAPLSASPPSCAVDFQNYDLIMVEAEFHALDNSFITLLTNYLQGGGSLYFMNDCDTPNTTTPSQVMDMQQNINDLLTSINESSIELLQTPSTSNFIPIVNANGPITNGYTFSEIDYYDGGYLVGASLANATTISSSIGVTNAFYCTPFGGILGIGTEVLSSGIGISTNGMLLGCPGDAAGLVWNFMNPEYSLCGSVPLSATIQGDTICEGNCTSLQISVTGGTPPYSTAWNNGIITNGLGPIEVCPTETTTYQITVTDGENSISTITATVVVQVTPELILADSLTICEPGTINLQEIVETMNPLGSVSTWLDNQMQIQISTPNAISENGWYYVQLSNGICSVQDSIKITIYQKPLANFEMNANYISNTQNTIQFVNTSTGSQNYLWDFGDGTTSNEISPNHLFQIDESIDFTVGLYAISPDGCLDSMFITIPIHHEEIEYYVPNTFTPDGNNLNNIFTPIFSDEKGPDYYKFQLFNRWGECIFETNNYLEGWSGETSTQICNDGVYTWKIEFGFENNSTIKKIEGYVNLLK